MGDWLFIGELSTLLATAFLLLIYVSVYRRRPSRAMFFWIIGWALMSVRFGFGILSGLVGPSHLFTIIYHGSTAASSLMMLRAVLPFSAARRFKLFGSAAFAAAGFWIVFSTLFLKSVFWISLPTFGFFGAVQIFNGIILLRSLRRFDSLGTRVAGWSFIAWGLHKWDYPFLRPIVSLAPYGYVFGAFLQLLVGVGFLMQQYEQTENEARKLAETLVEKDRRLKESEETYRTLVHGLPDIVLRFDTQFRHIFVSGNVVDLLGENADRCLGKSLRELGGEDSVCAFWENAVEKVLADGIPSAAELILDKSSSGPMYDVRFLPTRGADGSIESVVAIARDITLEKRAYDHLALEHERLRSLVRILEYETAEEQPLLDFALAEAVRLTGSPYGYIYRYDETSRRFTLNSWSGLVMDDCKIRDPSVQYELDKTGYWGEVVRRREPVIVNDFSILSRFHKGYPEGHVAISRFLSVPVIIDEQIVGVVGVANKPTEYELQDADQLRLLLTPVFSWAARQRSVNEIAEKDSLINAMIESMDDLMITLDEDGRYTGLFGKWFKTNNVDTGFFIGKTIEEAFGLPDAEPHLAALSKARAEGRAVYEWTLPGLPPADSPVIQTVFSSIYKDGLRAGFVGIGRDITNLVRAEQRLAALLEEKTALVQEVQHRVKNNLQLIISLIELQRSAVSESSESGQLRILQSRVHALAGAFSDLGGTASAEFVNLSVHLNALAASVNQLHFSPARAFSITVDADSSIALRMDVAVPVGLIVHEFIINSVRHAVPSFGYVHISVKAFSREFGRCEITVSDNGASVDQTGLGPEKRGIGFILAEGLAGQVQGTVSHDARDGYSSTLSFPMDGAGRPKSP